MLGKKKMRWHLRIQKGPRRGQPHHFVRCLTCHPPNDDDKRKYSSMYCTVGPPIGRNQIHGGFILGPKHSILYYKLMQFLVRFMAQVIV